MTKAKTDDAFTEQRITQLEEMFKEALYQTVGGMFQQAEDQGNDIAVIASAVLGALTDELGRNIAAACFSDNPAHLKVITKATGRRLLIAAQEAQQTLIATKGQPVPEDPKTN